jgi:hypothetical protein
MIQKIATYIFLALFIVTLGAASVFYLYTFKPLDANYKRMSAGLPELEKAKAELNKTRAKESQETAWIGPAVSAANGFLSDEIKAGKAEVLSAADRRVIVNIPEQALYMPGSYTFSPDSPLLRAKLVSLLKSKEVKGKTILIGNSTAAAPSQTVRRKKIPGKDARTLAAERSAVLIKDFEKNGVEQDLLVAAAYSSKQPDIGSIKGHKTMIVIESPPAVLEVAAKKEATPAPAPKSSATVTSAPPQAQPKPAPIQPSQPASK